jgi:hypothetical protein
MLVLLLTTTTTKLIFNFQRNDTLSMFCMKSTSLKILIFDFLLLLNFESQELSIVLGIFISLWIWIFLIEFPITKIIQNLINSHTVGLKYENHIGTCGTYQELFNWVLFQLYQDLNWVYCIFCKVIKLVLLE